MPIAYNGVTVSISFSLVVPCGMRTTLLLLALAAFFQTVFQGTTALFAAPAQTLPTGLMAKKPDAGRFVETPKGFMVPYTQKIPGTEQVFQMVPIPGGTFLLGSPDTESGRSADEALR